MTINFLFICERQATWLKKNSIATFKKIWERLLNCDYLFNITRKKLQWYVNSYQEKCVQKRLILVFNIGGLQQRHDNILNNDDNNNYYYPFTVYQKVFNRFLDENHYENELFFIEQQRARANQRHFGGKNLIPSSISFEVFAKVLWCQNKSRTVAVLAFFDQQKGSVTSNKKNWSNLYC